MGPRVLRKLGSFLRGKAVSSLCPVEAVAVTHHTSNIQGVLLLWPYRSTTWLVNARINCRRSMLPTDERSPSPGAELQPYHCPLREVARRCHVGLVVQVRDTSICEGARHEVKLYVRPHPCPCDGIIRRVQVCKVELQLPCCSVHTLHDYTRGRG